MDKEVYQNTLNQLCQDEKYQKYHDLFKQLTFDETKLVYQKYLYVSPPIPNIVQTNEQIARNILSMTYNHLYNLKYNINPYASDDESSSDDT